MFWGKHHGQLPSTSPDILPNEIMNHIRYLSDNDRGGRYPGSIESRDVISYIIRHFRSFGIRPGAENGSFVQTFNIVDGIELGKHNEMVIAGDSLSLSLDSVSYTHLRAHETSLHLVCRLLLEKNGATAVSYTHLTLPTKA